MKRMFFLTALVVGMATLTAASYAASMAVNLNFDTDAAGVPLPTGDGSAVNLTQPFTGFGVLLSTNNPDDNPLVLFNSNCGPDFPGTPCTGGDGDLASGPSFDSDPQGNVLIIQDDTLPLTTPGDDADGGFLGFEFTDLVGVRLDSVGILDLDEGVSPTFTVTQLIGGAPVVSSFTMSDPEVSETLLNPAFPGNNSLRVFGFTPPLASVIDLKVGLPDVSGSVAFVDYGRVPEPSSAALIALCGIMFSLRRRSR